jgi:methyl-accepting chemotaxis protein
MSGVAAEAGSGRFWADLSVNLKIMIAITVAAVVALLIGILGLRALASASDSAQWIYRSNVIGVSALGELKAWINQSRVDLVGHVVYPEAAAKQKYEAAFDKDLTEVDSAMADYEATTPAASPELVAAVKDSWQQYVAIAHDQLIPTSRRNEINAWGAIRDQQITPLVTEIRKQLEEVDAAENAAASASASAARSAYESSRLQSILLLVIGITGALALGIVVARGIVRSLSRVTTVCEGLADGDLTQQTGLTSRDEPGRMGRALDAAVTRLRDTVSTIGGSAVTLASASEELSTVSAQLQSGAADVADKAGSASAASENVNVGVQSIAAGAEEMSASITEIASNASDAARVAQEGMSVAERTNNQVAELGAASAEIGDVVRLITSIAEQTNLLALNATIETATTGEMSRSVAEAATNSGEVARTVSGVAEVATATADGARATQQAAADLTRLAGDLTTLVGGFRH